MQKTGSRAFHSSSTRSLVASPRQTSYPSRLSQAIRPNNNQKRLYSNATSNTVIPPPRPSRLPRTLILIGALSASTVIAWYTSETFRHSTIAILRCGRVGVVAAQCILDYSTVMRKKYSSSEEENQAMSDCHKRSAKTTYNAMRRNGGIYIKLGQHISAMVYLLPTEWCLAMVPLQDQCPESSFDSIKKMVESEISMQFDEMFSEFDAIPIGVASLAQVHRARLRGSNKEVAVKVQHPFVEEFARVDMEAVTVLFNWIKWLFPDFQFTWLSDEMNKSLPIELDFRIEGENAGKVRQNFKSVKHTTLKIPEVYWSNRRVMAMEYIHGSRIDNLEYLAEHNIDRNLVSQQLSHIFSTMIFVQGWFHADPHPGNLLIRNSPPSSTSPYNFEIVLLDHGLYRSLEQDFRFNYAHLWLSLIDGFNEDDMHKYVRLVANIAPDEDRPWDKLFVSALTGRAFDAVSEGISSVPQDAQEIARIKEATSDGLMFDIMTLLARVPRILLLLFKTNDLTRSLDNSLQTTHGYGRPFVIMARYCIQAVHEELQYQLSYLRRTKGFFSRDYLGALIFGNFRLWIKDIQFMLYERWGDVSASLRRKLN